MDISHLANKGAKPDNQQCCERKNLVLFDRSGIFLKTWERAVLKISVVTATYNRSATIGHTLESVANQTYPLVEHLVQDGGSTDGTLEQIHSSLLPVKLISAPDNGIYDAINKGIARATGDVVGVMHSDDFFASNWILEAIASAFDDPNVDGVYGDLDYVAADMPNRVIRRWRSGQYSLAKLRRGWMPPHPTLYLRKEVFATWGAYDTSFRIAADYEAILRWLSKGQIRLNYIPRVMVKMRVGGESNRSLGRIILKSREDYRALRRNGVGGVGALTWKNLGKLDQFIRKA